MPAPTRSATPPKPAKQANPAESTVLRKAERHTPLPGSELLEPGASCVHPQHGVVQVTGIVERDVSGNKIPLYELKLVASDGKILLPVAAAASAGLRPIMSEGEADEILAFMRTRRAGVDSRPFQKRMRIYGEMMRSGDRKAIAEVLRDMNRTAESKDLSFGERKLLTQARTMLVTEIALAKHTTVEAVEGELEAAFVA